MTPAIPRFGRSSSAGRRSRRRRGSGIVEVGHGRRSDPSADAGGRALPSGLPAASGPDPAERAAPDQVPRSRVLALSPSRERGVQTDPGTIYSFALGPQRPEPEGSPAAIPATDCVQEADWQLAVDGLATPIDDMLENRKRARRADITRCLGALTADQGGQLLANGDRPGHSTVVAFAVGAGDVSTASAKADELLSSCPTLRTYVVVPERREPILIFRRDRPRLRKLIDDDERWISTWPPARSASEPEISVGGQRRNRCSRPSTQLRRMTSSRHIPKKRSIEASRLDVPRRSTCAARVRSRCGRDGLPVAVDAVRRD